MNHLILSLHPGSEDDYTSDAGNLVSACNHIQRETSISQYATKLALGCYKIDPTDGLDVLVEIVGFCKKVGIKYTVSYCGGGFVYSS